MKIRCGEAAQIIKLGAICPVDAHMEDDFCIEGVRRKQGRLSIILDAMRRKTCPC